MTERESLLPARKRDEPLDAYLQRLATVFGWGSREVQDAYDYGMGMAPDE